MDAELSRKLGTDMAVAIAKYRTEHNGAPPSPELVADAVLAHLGESHVITQAAAREFLVSRAAALLQEGV